MAEKDLVVSGLKAKQDKVVFQMDDLYIVMKNWGKLNRYYLIEKAIEHEATPDGKEEIIKWELKREADDHTQFVIRSFITINGRETVVKKRGKCVKGSLSVNIDSWIVVDYEGKWEENPIFKFMRDFYDRLILRGRYKDQAKVLRNDTHDFYNEIRAFLDLHIPKKQ